MWWENKNMTRETLLRKVGPSLPKKLEVCWHLQREILHLREYFDENLNFKKKKKWWEILQLSDYFDDNLNFKNRRKKLWEILQPSEYFNENLNFKKKKKIVRNFATEVIILTRIFSSLFSTVATVCES